MPDNISKIIGGQVKQEFTWENGEWKCVKQKFTADNDDVHWEDAQGNEVDEPEDNSPGLISYAKYQAYEMVQPELGEIIQLTAICCHEAIKGYWNKNDEGFDAMKNDLEKALNLINYPQPDYAARDEEEEDED